MKTATRDNLIYLTVALGIVGALVAYMFVSERVTGSVRPIPGAVLWGLLSTPVIVALIFERFWSQRRRARLWFVALVAGAINIAVIAASYYRGWRAPILVWSTMTALLFGLAMTVIKKVLQNEKDASGDVQR